MASLRRPSPACAADRFGRQLASADVTPSGGRGAMGRAERWSPTSSWSVPAWPGLAAARALAGRRVATWSCSKRATASAAGCSTTTLGDGDVVEVGGEWIGPAQLRINKLVAELGLETFPTYNEGENLLDLDGRVKRYTGEIPPLAQGRARRPRPVAAALRPAGASACRSKRRGRPTAPSVGTRRRSRPGCGATRAPRARGSSGRCSPRRCSRPSRRTSRCCTRSSTRTPAAA